MGSYDLPCIQNHTDIVFFLAMAQILIHCQIPIRRNMPIFAMQSAKPPQISWSDPLRNSSLGQQWTGAVGSSSFGNQPVWYTHEAHHYGESSVVGTLFFGGMLVPTSNWINVDELGRWKLRVPLVECGLQSMAVGNSWYVSSRIWLLHLENFSAHTVTRSSRSPHWQV